MNKDESTVLYEEDLEKIDITGVLDDMWKGFVRFWPPLILIAALCAGILFVRARMTYVPYYTAYATYTVSTGTSSDTYENTAAATEIGATMRYILTSKVLQTMVAEDMGRDTVPGTVRVNVMENTNLFTISVDSASPENAFEVLHAVIRNYPRVAQNVIGMTQLDMMDESGMPQAPANSPGYRHQIMRGIILGLMIDTFLLLVYALTRHTIQKEDDFKKYLNIECFGLIPRARLKRRSKHNTRSSGILLDHPGMPVSYKEAVRSVRNRLERRAKARDQKVILVTSAMPEEGKSTVAANLALSLAAKGYSTILADMDLRNPSLADILGLAEGPGMIDILKGKNSLEEVMMPYQETRLRIISGGKPAASATRILSDQVMTDLIEKLRGQADFVILDTPPCAVLSDASIIARAADASLFVVRQDYARVDRILEGIRNLSETGVDVTGCVLNFAQAGVTGYGGYNYGYGHYHSYS